MTYAVCSRPGRIRVWDETKGAHFMQDTVVYEVQTLTGEVLAQASESAVIVATAKMLGSFNSASVTVEDVIKAIGAAAVSKYAKEMRQRETSPPQNPTERHSLAT